MIAHVPSAGEIRNGSRTTTGTIVTIPAGRTLTANIQISASISVAGTATTNVSIAGGGTGVEPAAASVLCRLSIAGLALNTVTSNAYQEILVVAGDADATLEFNTGGASSASVTVNGFLL